MHKRSLVWDDKSWFVAVAGEIFVGLGGGHAVPDAAAQDGEAGRCGHEKVEDRRVGGARDLAGNVTDGQCDGVRVVAAGDAGIGDAAS